MSQTTQCLEVHVPYLKIYETGIWVCLLCAAKTEMAHDLKTKLLNIKLSRGWLGCRAYLNGQWEDA